ncbi:reverse transcriptase domain-containing protein [Tanacetum coccineum]
MSLRTIVLAQMSEIRELHDADRRRQAVISEMLKADHRRSTEMREGDSTTETSDHLAGAGDSITGTGHSTTGIGYRTIGIAGTRWRSCTARAARGGWSTPVITTPALTATTTTSVTNAQLQAMIDQGVSAALAARDANRNGDDSHTSGTGGRRTERIADLRKKMTDKYCPRNEMKKLGAELWNLKVKGTDVIGYNQRFQELELLCVRMFPEESNKIERSVGNANTANNQRGTGSGKKRTCFECRVQGHYKRECPKLKNNQNRGNQGGNDRAPAKVYVVGRARTNPDSNVMMGMFLLNNRYASILFDTGADRSFVSTAFSS